MKQGFKFSSGKTAYSIDGLRRLCEQEANEATQHLNNGYIEQWLDYIGETDLANIAYQIRTNQIILLNRNKIQTLSDYLDKHITFQKILDFLDKNKSIDIILKEYEMLRNEIINFFQNRIQLITLGLAAIFTLVGLGLAPLTNFLTTDKITFNHPVSITVKETKKTENKLQLNFDVNQKNGQKLLIEKTIKENKIAGAAIPSIIIFFDYYIVCYWWNYNTVF